MAVCAVCQLVNVHLKTNELHLQDPLPCHVTPHVWVQSFVLAIRRFALQVNWGSWQWLFCDKCMFNQVVWRTLGRFYEFEFMEAAGLC